MSTTVDPGSARPGRLIGLVLLGIAALAALLGVLSLINGGNGGQSQPTPPPQTSSTGQPSGTGQPGATGQPSAQPSAQPSSGPTGSQPAPPPPAQTSGNQPPPAPPASNPRAVPVRVYNNSKIDGLAANAAADFRADGWNVVEVGNYSQGIIATSTVYFRPGTEEEAAAKELGAKFNLRVEQRFPGIENSSPGLIVIVTNDYGGK